MDMPVTSDPVALDPDQAEPLLLAMPVPMPDWSALLMANRSGKKAATLAALKEALGGVEQELQQRFESGGRAKALMPARSALYDSLIRGLLTHAVKVVFPAANPTKGEIISVAAVGGYGRGMLAPFSDIDLLFLHAHKLSPHSEQVIEYVLYMLWDLGLKVGQAVRTPGECARMARDDHTIATALLEARQLWGDVALYQEMTTQFAQKGLGSNPIAYVDAKLEERDQRHRRMGDTRYVLEPNIKDGKGGQRDLHTLMWIAKALYQVDDVQGLVDQEVLSATEAARFSKAEAFLSDVRCHLHYLVGRAEERLTFDHQATLAERMNYQDRPHARSVERFMRHYFIIAKDVGDLTRSICSAFEAKHHRPKLFSISRLLSFEKSVGPCHLRHERLTMKSDSAFIDDPLNLLRLFHIAQEYDVDIHPEALRLVRRDLRMIDQVRDTPEANRLFLEMLTSAKDPIVTLRRLNEAGLFGRFLQPWGRIVAMMQYNMYHSYTVDEHTIRAVAELRRMEAGELIDVAPVASEVVKQVPQRRALYVAVLFHDIGKGRGGDHSVIGAALLHEYGPRLGLTPAETETAVWLVRHHLVMSDIAQRRDPSDPKTIQDFCEIVQSPDRLRQLLVLTVCDIRAVGPDTWTGWKASLLRELYYRADEAMAGSMDQGSLVYRAEIAKEALTAALADWPEAELADHLSSTPERYLVAWDTPTLAQHAHLMREARASDHLFAMDFQEDPDRDSTVVTICALDHTGLFARLAGVMALAGADIGGARAYTLNNGYVIDSFWIQSAEGGVFTDHERILERAAQVMSGQIQLGTALQQAPAWASRTAVFKVEPRVIIDNEASRVFTVIEVNGRDRPGFLNKVAYAMTQLGLQIASSHIVTYGERAVDVFYVKDIFGLKVVQPGKLCQIEHELTEAIRESNALVMPETV
ncbi:MAG: [protein-PII] uridylyltransferase [Alphaproteobacteria bacterium]|jgi:[protein-PII] uridylyltransferase